MPEDLAHQQVARADRREDDLDDPALLLLDDAGQHREPEAEDADEDEHGADVGEQEARARPPRSAGRAHRPSVPAGRPASSPGETSASASTACMRSATTDAVTSWVTTWSGSFVEADRPRRRTGRPARRRPPRPARPRARPRAGGRVGVRHDLDLAVELAAAVAVIADVEPGRFRLDDADPSSPPRRRRGAPGRRTSRPRAAS